MFNYIIRRILLLVPTLLATTVVVFAVMAASPGRLGGNDMNEEGNVDSQAAKAALQERIRRYGLDKPLPIQYGHWLNGVSPLGWEIDPDGSLGHFKLLKVPDLGNSQIKGRPVLDLILEAMPITILLNLITLPITQIIAISAGLYSGRHRGGLVDKTTGSAFLAMWSIPTILAASLMIGFLALRQDYDFQAIFKNLTVAIVCLGAVLIVADRLLGGSKRIYRRFAILLAVAVFVWLGRMIPPQSRVQLFPTSGLHDLHSGSMRFLPHTDPVRGWNRGYMLDTGWHLLLPIVCLTYGGFAFLSRLVRGSVIDNLSADYTRTARAKGVGETTILLRHVFRNSLLPLITSSAGLLPGLIGGSLIIEHVFSLHGMGFLMLEAVKAKDTILVMDQALVVGGIGLVSYLIADVLYVAGRSPGELRMTAIQSSIPLELVPTEAPLAQDPTEPLRGRSYMAILARKTLSKASTRLAVLWILIITGLAVFAPMLANSNPYLVQMDGHCPARYFDR